MRKLYSRNPESYNRNQKRFNQLHPLLKMKSQMIRGRNLMKGQVMSPWNLLKSCKELLNNLQPKGSQHGLKKQYRK
jgi:hypothetical protein